jgi:hypothetical protein
LIPSLHPKSASQVFIPSLHPKSSAPAAGDCGADAGQGRVRLLKPGCLPFSPAAALDAKPL